METLFTVAERIVNSSFVVNVRARSKMSPTTTIYPARRCLHQGLPRYRVRRRLEFKPSVAEDHVVDEKETVKLWISERLSRLMYPSIIAHPYPAHVQQRKDQPSGARGVGFDTNADVGLPQSDVEVALHKTFSDILKPDPSQLGVTHHTFVSLLAVQAEVSIGQLFKLNAGLINIYLGYATSPRHLPSFLLTRVHSLTIRELSNVIIDAIGQDQRQIMDAQDSDNDFLIELLPIKKNSTHPGMFIVHDIAGMATLCVSVSAP